ncbi:MAG: flagellar hook-basal body complex protein FliE [Treponema sp.]|nr:flagellar hook-basal body complex protein FliE [Treponema sp.]
MKIPEFGTLQMARVNEAHYGTGAVTSLTNTKDKTGLLHTTEKEGTKSFQDYLLDAMETVNNQQLEVDGLSEKIMTNPDEVDIHDVTIAMSKARMSLNLAQTVIDRLITDWNEITTTR